jgi:hypothetical protein
MTVYGPQPPHLADIAAATAATQAAIDDPRASLADIERAAQAEQATYAAWRHAPELDHATPDLEVGA